MTKRMRGWRVLFTRKQWVAGVAIAGCMLIVGLIIVRLGNSTTASLPRSFIDSTAFTPYFYRETIPAGLALNLESTSYNAGVLLIHLVNKDQKSVVITQQATPPNLQGSKVQGNEEIDGAPGSAALTYKEGRTTGTLLTRDKTMVIVTSADEVVSSSIKDLIRFLKPMR